jgi:glycosyltransferase involved in cell wall biosynthesis
MAPYTHLLYAALARTIAEPLHVLACVAREPSRSWDLPPAEGFTVEVLPGFRKHRDATRNFYLNPAVGDRLGALAPRVVIVNDFSPTTLLAARAARRRGIAVGVETDGTLATDPGARSAVRRFMRRAIAGHSDFGIGPSFASLDLLHFYGVSSDRLFLAPLTAGWMPTRPALPLAERPYDILFCGSLNDEFKGARFFAEVAEALAARRPGLTVRVAGEGPLRGELETRFAAAGISARFDGFVQQGALEEVYNSARLFLFPSRIDPWGIVANEAIQCGTPVIASPHATAATELVLPAGAGMVLPLRRDDWVEAALALLGDPARWQATHEHALAISSKGLLDQAVAAYRSAIARYAP